MGAPEIIRMITFALRALKFVIDLYKAQDQREQKMEVELDSLMHDLEYLMDPRLNFNKVGGENYVDVTELIYDIQDFAQSLWIPGSSGPLLAAIGVDPREGYLIRINGFKNEIKKLLERQKEPEPALGSDSASSSSAAESPACIAEPKEVLLVMDLLKKPEQRGASNSASSSAGGQDALQSPKVISIVGCPGVGKTFLARAVYNNLVRHSDEFECVAWVEAAGCNDKTALAGKILQEVQRNLESRRLPMNQIPVQENILGRIHRSIATVVPKVFRNPDHPSDSATTRRASLVPSQDNGDAASPDLRGILADKRYLVFIDDVQQAEVLKDIIDSQFPKNAKSGMVIVTTSVRQVAEVRSHGSYVHTMKCLDDTRSQELLFSTMDANRVSKQVRQGSKGIITKCGGLPLALTSVARHMSIQPRRLDKDFCVAVGKQLGSKYLSGIKGEAQFKELKRALEQCFEALPNNDHKTYMLSLGMFPRNDPIRCKSLARRLKAEELLDNVDGDGKECLDELVNHCIVEPVQISSCSQDLKRCRVNVGIMLEFIIQKSWSTNFVNVIREEDELRDPRRRIRRLSVQSSKSCDEIKALAGKYSMSGTIRSLTIVPPVGRSELDPSERISELSDDIKSCKFLRLLDLEGCDGINEAFFRGICELVYLRYLSLRKTDVKNIPVEIRNLQCLQTLDVRGTKDIVLLVKEVITLPDLAFLFGKFELPEMSKETKKFLSTKSKLQTIAEIVVNQQGNGPEEIIREAKNLRKVKVCYIGTRSVQDIGRGKEIRPGRFRFARRIFRTLCTCGRPCASGSHPASSQSSVSPSQQTSNNGLVEALQSRCTSLNSVSIESNDLSNDITAYLLAGPCKIDRMKLSGKLCGLPVESTLKLIGTLNKLQLSNTGLTIDELSILENISSLEYLKLKDDQEGSWGGTFSLHENGFESLRRLCFEASKLPKLEFHPGSMKRLTSLHLLCLDICQMQIVKEITESIRNITSLNEVILHHSASATEGMVEAWKIAAKSNPNRPCVTTSTCW